MRLIVKRLRARATGARGVRSQENGIVKRDGEKRKDKKEINFRD